MTRILRSALVGGLVILASGAARAAGVDEVLQQALGREVELNGSVLMAIFAATFPVGMIAVWVSVRLIASEIEEVGGKAFVVAFFHRLMFTVAFWCVVLMELHQSVPIPDGAIIFLTSLTAATLAFRFSVSEPMGRILTMAVVFCLLDSVLMGFAMAGSLAVWG